MRGHPKGLYLLFTIEMWERFSYYGMRAILMLYMTKFLMFDVKFASLIYGPGFTGLVYLTPLIGGMIADRYLGQRKSIFIGAIVMALGQFSLAASAFSSPTLVATKGIFYFGLLLLIIGNGFFKPNISTIVGALYERNDPRRDGAFTVFYMGINLGAFFSPLICGTLGEKFNWGYGFLAAGVGMLVGLSVYLWGQKKYLGDICLTSAHHSVTINSDGVKVKTKVVHESLKKEEWQQIAVIFILTFFSVFFWTAFEQAGSSLTLFADRSTDRAIPFLNWVFPASWFQSINPFLIFVLAPLFSFLWVFLSEKKLNPSTPMKFVFALLLLGLGFVMMVIGSHLFVTTGKPVSFMWLTLAYFFHTTGELCLSPVGLSMVTKLSPVRLVSMLMGVWLMSSWAANTLGGILAGMYESLPLVTFFMIFVIASAVAAVILFVLKNPIKRWMHGIH